MVQLHTRGSWLLMVTAAPAMWRYTPGWISTASAWKVMTKKLSYNSKSLPMHTHSACHCQNWLWGHRWTGDQDHADLESAHLDSPIDIVGSSASSILVYLYRLLNTCSVCKSWCWYEKIYYIESQLGNNHIAGVVVTWVKVCLLSYKYCS